MDQQPGAVASILPHGMQQQQLGIQALQSRCLSLTQGLRQCDGGIRGGAGRLSH